MEDADVVFLCRSLGWGLRDVLALPFLDFIILLGECRKQQAADDAVTFWTPRSEAEKKIRQMNANPDLPENNALLNAPPAVIDAEMRRRAMMLGAARRDV